MERPEGCPGKVLWGGRGGLKFKGGEIWKAGGSREVIITCDLREAWLCESETKAPSDPASGTAQS